MKIKIFYTLIIILSSAVSVFAQIEKGSLMLGGLAYYTKQSSQSGNTNLGSTSKINTGTFDVSAGYTIKNNQVLGVIASYNNYKLNSNSNAVESGSQGNNTKSIGAFYRIYHSLGNGFYVYGQAAATYSHRKETTAGIYNYTARTNAGNLSVSPGISYAILKNVQLELAIPNLVGITYSKSKGALAGNTLAPTVESFSANTSLNNGILSNLGVGFKIFIP
ncbi:hypothetical protein ACTJIJ_10565 [Niabella sp. 22666]|uniref:hypothetical protein n=1 Tax=Niabella sp. 22666 TaxID=3453954 RepID=UPI003F83BEFD